MDIFLPTQLAMASSKIRYLDNTGISPPTYTGLIRTAAIGGDKVGASLEFTPSGGGSAQGQADRAAIRALVFRLRGRQNRIYLPDHSYQKQGNYAAVELLPNNTFASGVTGWTASSSAIVLKSSQRILRSVRSTVVSNETILSGALTVANGAYYVARAFVNAGSGVLNFRLYAGTSAGGNQLAQSAADIAVDGMATLGFTASGTTAYFSILDKYTGKGAGDFMDIAYVSLSRCMVAANTFARGATQMVCATGLGSTDDVLLPGDQFEVLTSVGSELKFITAPAMTDAGGGCVLNFGPPLRGSVAYLTPIILATPYGRFIATTPPELGNDPGAIVRTSMELQEAA